MMFQEELLDEKNQCDMSTSIIDLCGPLSLLTFIRCMELREKYEEFKDIKPIHQLGFKC